MLFHFKLTTPILVSTLELAQYLNTCVCMCVSVSDSQKQQPQQIISTTHFCYFYYTPTTTARTTRLQLLSSHGASAAAASFSSPVVATSVAVLHKNNKELMYLPLFTVLFILLFFCASLHLSKCFFYFLCLCFGPRFVHWQYRDVGLSSFRGDTHT